MSEAGPSLSAKAASPARKRNLLILVSAVPTAALFALLGWAVARTGGTPGGFGVNNEFGEIGIERRAAPDFTKDSLSGETVRLSELRGKVVMVDFWTSWCPPCRREAPTLAEVYREYAHRNVEFIGVAIWDDRNRVEDYVLEFDLPYLNLIDEKGRIAIDYGVAGIPEKFFIDGNGDVVRKFVGPMDAESLREALDNLVAPVLTRGSASP